jgi:uncharacterized surface protein with fasciclin (FAS1) repeats
MKKNIIMKHRNICTKVLGAVIIALTFIGCTDKWDDHYDAAATGEGTLWEAISSNPDLSNFASVVKACGYDTTLVSNQIFTVFAPVNENFTSDQANALITAYQQQKQSGVKTKDNTTIKEFLQNHIALYNYSTAKTGSDSIVMMNGKYSVLTPSTFSGKTILTSNQLYGNGILFTLNNKADFSPNIFEYLAKDNDLSEIYKYMYSYNQYELDESKSVAGGIVDGKTVYLDSVMVLNNKLFDYMGELNSEDSTYYWVVPTNDVWKEKIAEYTKYFNYDNTTSKRDSLQDINSHLALLRGTVFSRSNNTDASIKDSAMSVNAVPYKYRIYNYGTYDAHYYQYYKPYATGGVFNGTQNTTCSNGQIMKASTWNIDKLNTFFQKIIVEGESSEALDSVDRLTTRAPLTTVDVQSKSKFYNKVSRNSYAEILSTSGSSRNTKAVFNVPQVLSNLGYDIYIVTVPAIAGDTLASAEERLPTKIRCSLSYNQQSGAALATPAILLSSINTTADAMDTIKVASNVVIPTCSWGSNFTPQVKLILETRVSNTEVRNGTFNRIIRLDCIIFKPHEE